VEAVRIVLFATAAAIIYGVLHDLVTANLCIEYFTVAHPPIFPTRSPILLALGWGVIATWWVGLALGIGLAMAARIGAERKMGLDALRRPIVLLMVATAGAAIVAGAVGAGLSAAGFRPIPDIGVAMIPANRQVAFSADAWAHAASYGFGAVGGLFLIARTLRRRRREGDRAAQAASPPSPT
jgi:hypothetical protein